MYESNFFLDTLCFREIPPPPSVFLKYVYYCRNEFKSGLDCVSIGAFILVVVISFLLATSLKGKKNHYESFNKK